MSPNRSFLSRAGLVVWHELPWAMQIWGERKLKWRNWAGTHEVHATKPRAGPGTCAGGDEPWLGGHRSLLGSRMSPPWGAALQGMGPRPSICCRVMDKQQHPGHARLRYWAGRMGLDRAGPPAGTASPGWFAGSIAAASSHPQHPKTLQKAPRVQKSTAKQSMAPSQPLSKAPNPS